jgi:[ribosomal protein S18]-alanine N-acetyltransferase
MSAGGAVGVRRMTASDLDAVLAIAASLKQAPQWAREAYEAALDGETGPLRVALVSEIDERVTGFAVASVVAPEAELETIAVAGAWQRRGVAKALWAALAEELKLAGARVTLLEVRTSNGKALGLYGRLGFAETGRRKGYYADPKEDAVLMRLELG